MRAGASGGAAVLPHAPIAECVIDPEDLIPYQRQTLTSLVVKISPAFRQLSISMMSSILGDAWGKRPSLSWPDTGRLIASVVQK